MKQNKEYSLLKNTAIFFLGNFCSKILMLLIIPLYTFYVSVEEMGQYDILHSYVNLFLPIFCFCLYEGVYRWLLVSKNNYSEIIVTGFTSFLILVIVCNFISVIFFQYFEYKYQNYFILYIDSLILYTLTQFITRGLRNNKLYAIQGILYTFLFVGLNAYFVMKLKLGISGIVWSAVISNSISSITILFKQKIFSKILFLKFNFYSNFKLFIDLLKYSLPLVPNSVAWWLVSCSNRLIVNFKLGDQANGVFSISLQLSTILTLAASFFYQAWQEQAISGYNDSDRNNYYTKIFNLYVRVLLFFCLILIPFSKIVILCFMENSYKESLNYVGILYISSVFNALSAFYGTGYLCKKKTLGSLYTTILGAIANISVTYLLISFINLYAAAIGNLIGNFIIWIVRVFSMKSYFRIAIDWKNLIFLTFINFILIIIVNYLTLFESLIVFAFIVLFLVIYIRSFIKSIFLKILTQYLPFQK